MIVIKNWNVQIKTKSRFYSFSVCLNLAGWNIKYESSSQEMFLHFHILSCKITLAREMTKLTAREH